MFESGSGGDFKTFIGESTKSIYRLNMEKIQYLKLLESDILKDAKNKEGELRITSQEIQCLICNSKFSASSILVSGEEVIEAYDI